jgi:hypothetical protein
MAYIIHVMRLFLMWRADNNLMNSN